MLKPRCYVIFKGFCMLSLILAAAVSANPSVCKNLSSEFNTNEQVFSIIHDIHAAQLATALKFEADVAPSERNLAIEIARLRAVGGVPRNPAPRGPSGADSVAEARAQLEKTDEKYKLQGDRITTLMIANKCTPPDHVTTWMTYSDKNPNAQKR